MEDIDKRIDFLSSSILAIDLEIAKKLQEDEQEQYKDYQSEEIQKQKKDEQFAIQLQKEELSESKREHVNKQNDSHADFLLAQKLAQEEKDKPIRKSELELRDEFFAKQILFEEKKKQQEEQDEKYAKELAQQQSNYTPPVKNDYYNHKHYILPQQISKLEWEKKRNEHIMVVHNGICTCAGQHVRSVVHLKKMHQKGCGCSQYAGSKYDYEHNFPHLFYQNQHWNK